MKCLDDPGGVVGRTIVDDEGLQLAGIMLPRDRLQCLGDRLPFVERRNEDADARVMSDLLARRTVVEEQADDERNAFISPGMSAMPPMISTATGQSVSRARSRIHGSAITQLKTSQTRLRNIDSTNFPRTVR